MVRKAKLKNDSKKKKSSHHKELSSLKKLLSDYKVERKANWKSFKNKMNDNIDKIEKSINKLATGVKK
ncbi:MAG: hypothetical protein ABIU77_14680 [Ferruginibacter sp.]|jgi:hypothetical protein